MFFGGVPVRCNREGHGTHLQLVITSYNPTMSIQYFCLRNNRHPENMEQRVLTEDGGRPRGVEKKDPQLSSGNFGS